MIPNTPLFADFIKTARTSANLTQDNLHERGASYRQLQGRIENGDLIDLEEGGLAAYDRAYGWPYGYAAAVAQAAAYAAGELNPAGLDSSDENDRRAHQLHGPVHEGRPVRKTLAALYEPDRYKAPLALGFDPATGATVYAGAAIMTNVGMRTLQAVVDGRSGATLLDTQVLDDNAVRAIVSGPTARTRPRKFYRLTAAEGPLADYGGVAAPIALDPITDITNLSEARQLAKALLELRPSTPTTVERAAFTFLVVGAFGEDLFATVTRLQEERSGFTEFYEFWADFRARCNVSAQLAQPDFAALDLLGGLDTAREAAQAIETGSYRAEHPRRAPKPTSPATVRSVLLTDAEEDSFIFYDSTVASETPICLNHCSGGATVAIHRVDDLLGLARVSNPSLTLRSIGIAAADDLTVVAHHRYEHLDTLTNLFDKYAVLCSARRASVVWIPTV